MFPGAGPLSTHAVANFFTRSSTRKNSWLRPCKCPINMVMNLVSFQGQIMLAVTQEPSKIIFFFLEFSLDFFYKRSKNPIHQPSANQLYKSYVRLILNHGL